MKGSDPVAYINIVGTSISYPVMWSETAGYYLDHGSDGRKNRNGAIYLSDLNSPDFSDPINYIFGHNMNSGLMFHELNFFLEDSYLADHDICSIIVNGIKREYKLFRVNCVEEDSMIPFYNRDYYVKEMEGSYSIKYVLPALFKDDKALDYHNLDLVHNGSEAMESFKSLDSLPKEEQESLRKALLKYCELDTYAMVKIYEKLTSLS